MIIKANSIFSMESVAYQLDLKFFRALTKAIEELRAGKSLTGDTKKDRKAIEQSNIEKIIADNTGMLVQVHTPRDIGLNAFVSVPVLDRNHPLHDKYAREYVKAVTTKKMLKNGPVTGTIDLQTGKVSGDYSKISIHISAAAQLIESDAFQPEEVAAIFLHEIGHVMTYFEYLGRNVILHHVMGDLVRNYNESMSMQHRVEIIKSVKSNLDLDAIEPTVVAEIADGETVQQLIISEYACQYHSATNTHLYDFRTWEALADQYAARHGAALAQATALDKLYRYSGDAAYMGNVKYLIWRTFDFIALTVFSPFALLIMALAEPYEIYDMPIQRINRLRQDLINATKDKSLSKELRVRLMNDIADIEKLTAGLKDRESAFMLVWKNVFPTIRRQSNRTAMMQKLEELANNEIFVRSNRLKTLA